VAHFDPFAPANLAGKMLFDHDLDSIEDKPWRKPGADLTDYFNYGFTESTWRAYCIKQRALRDEFGAQKKISVIGERNEMRNERSERNEIRNEPRNEIRHERSDYRSGPERSDYRSGPERSDFRNDRPEPRYNDPRGQYDRQYDSSRRSQPHPQQSAPPLRSSRSPSNSPPPRRIVRQPADHHSRSPPP
jgi:hypothetical protein